MGRSRIVREKLQAIIDKYKIDVSKSMNMSNE